MDVDLRGRPVVTAAELDLMTPQEVDRAWSASIVTVVSVLPDEYVDRLRARAAANLAKRETRAAS